MELIGNETTVKKTNGAARDIERISQEVLRRLTEKTEPMTGPEPVPTRRNGFLELPVMVSISVRHAHLSPAHVEILFGKGYDLGVYSELHQKGYFAAKEQILVAGRKRCLETVRVLGPTRPYSQVELAQTDALQLGLKLPIATDGSDPASQQITLIGPEGVVNLPGGVEGGAFIARRHLHMSDSTAQKLGIKDGDLLDMHIDGPRSATLHGILVRTKAGWSTEVHLDTDEGNAVGIRSGQMGTLIIPTHRKAGES